MDDEQMSFFVTPEDVGRRAKEECRANKDQLSKIQATNKSKLVALVEADWYRDFVYWLNVSNLEHPGPIPNHLLCENGKLNTKLKLGSHFAVVSLEGWDILTKYFKGGPKIVRYYVLHPKTGKPTVITDPISLEITVNGKLLKKVVQANWPINPLRKLLCETLELNFKEYDLIGEDNEIISNDSTIEEIKDKSGLKWKLQLSERVTKKQYVKLGLNDREPRTLRPILSEPVFTFLDAPVLALFGLKPMRDYIFAKDLDGKINKQNESGSGGRVTALVRKLFRELGKPGTDPVPADDLNTFMLRRYPQFAHDDTHTAYDGLAALLDGLHEDTATGPGEGPFADLVFGDVRGSIECSICSGLEEMRERAAVIDLPLPEKVTASDAEKVTGDEYLASFEDVVAGFSLPVPMEAGARPRCSKCQRMGPSSKYLAVQSLRDVLIIKLNRFVRERVFERKVKTVVNFPFEVNSKLFTGADGPTYELASVIFHIGEIDSGIFTAAVVDDSGIWNYLPGGQEGAGVQIPKEDLINGDSFLLFYQIKKEK